MSQKKIFRCQDCGYETEVYEGRGFMGQHIEACLVLTAGT